MTTVGKGEMVGSRWFYLLRDNSSMLCCACRGLGRDLVAADFQPPLHRYKCCARKSQMRYGTYACGAGAVQRACEELTSQCAGAVSVWERYRWLCFTEASCRLMLRVSSFLITTICQVDRLLLVFFAAVAGTTCVHGMPACNV